IKYLTIFLFLNSLFLSFAFSQEIKLSNVAGSFYPEDKEELEKIIDDFLEEVSPSPREAKIFALISPHAGYIYSGRTASFGYKLIKDKPYKTVIIIAPSHFFGFKGISVYPEGVFRTPLGDIPIDKEFTFNLIYKDKDIFFEPRAFLREHSLEVQLPFLQRVLADFKIVPIVMGECDFSLCERLADLLFGIIKNRDDVLVVASTDMYHGHDYEEAETIDKLTLSYLREMESQRIYLALKEEKIQLCGGLPVVVTIALAKKLGHNKLEVLDYTNSAQVTGRKIKGVWTVGYTSCVIDKEEADMLNKEQRKRLLEIARQSIKTYLETGKKLEVKEADPLLNKEMGAFVTLHKYGELRGCIGNLVADKPLYLIVRDMAIESATADPRFAPLRLEELEEVDIEISVLSPLQRIYDIDKIELGKHGVLIKKGWRSGVFLPQVATETGWSKEEFLSNLCAHKAGLSPLAWKDKSTEIYIFTAEVFSERDY
ncbi:MAG: AmmeMemoRadiSam system protein B, partial [Candidatus Omnitrophica bacterium]|nr:AmmeMemoRadiSam system protein B [Candidatus Omnitrophota bacterium]